MERHSASIRQTARQLLAVPAAAWSRHRSLSERMRPAQQLGLRRPSEYGAGAGQRQPARIDGLVFLSDRAAGDPAAAAEQQADAAFDPRRDQHWSRR